MKIYHLIILVFIVSCKSGIYKKQVFLRGSVFGTTYSIKYESDENYQKSIDSLYSMINKSLSTYIKDSDISRINNNESNVEVDNMFLEVFQKAKRIYEETEGYFDPTVGRLVNAYGFGSENGLVEIPSQVFIKLKSLVGFDKVKIKDRTVIKSDPEVKFDVNALAKGYALDVVGRFLESKKISNYLVEIGGEVRVRGLNNGAKWKLGVVDPTSDGMELRYLKIVSLTDKCMATSGTYLKYKINDAGKKFVHIVNPITGLAEESDLVSVSVISDLDCADVDAYATAFLAMGLQRTKEFIKLHENLKVILMYFDKDNKLCVYEN